MLRIFIPSAFYNKILPFLFCLLYFIFFFSVSFQAEDDGHQFLKNNSYTDLGRHLSSFEQSPLFKSLKKLTDKSHSSIDKKAVDFVKNNFDCASHDSSLALEYFSIQLGEINFFNNFFLNKDLFVLVGPLLKTMLTYSTCSINYVDVFFNQNCPVQSMLLVYFAENCSVAQLQETIVLFKNASLAAFVRQICIIDIKKWLGVPALYKKLFVIVEACYTVIQYHHFLPFTRNHVNLRADQSFIDAINDFRSSFPLRSPSRGIVEVFFGRYSPYAKKMTSNFMSKFPFANSVLNHPKIANASFIVVSVCSMIPIVFVWLYIFQYIEKKRPKPSKSHTQVAAEEYTVS